MLRVKRSRNYVMPGPARTGAISKAPKIAKGLQSDKVFSSTAIEKTCNGSLAKTCKKIEKSQCQKN